MERGLRKNPFNFYSGTESWGRYIISFWFSLTLRHRAFGLDGINAVRLNRVDDNKFHVVTKHSQRLKKDDSISQSSFRGTSNPLG